MRSSRSSFSYMCITRSLSSAWMQVSPPAFATALITSQISPYGTMWAIRCGVMSVVNIFTDA